MLKEGKSVGMDDVKSSIWWVRHGPTHARTMVGWTDLPADLTDAAMVRRLADALPRNAPLLTSDLSRAVQTADAIQNDRLRLEADAALREMHFGIWENRAHSEIEAEDPDRIQAFWEHPGEVRPPGGESWNDLSKRVELAVNGLCQRHIHLIIVAHFGPILSQAQRAAGWTADETFAQRIEPLSITRIDYGTTRRIVTINHQP